MNCVAARPDVKSSKLLDRILQHKGVDLKAGKVFSQEARRIQWTTAKNLSMWFDNWEHDLVQLGFATMIGNTGNIHIADDQLERIINFDETCLSLDGSNGNRGGRPEVVFYNPLLSLTGKATSKSALTLTMITGSSASGEALPPHFQFQTAAQSDDTQRARIEMAA